jgi:hypothetical protein
MANRNSSFGEGQSGAKGAETGIIKPAVDRPALQTKGPGAPNQPAPVARPKVVDPDRPNIIEDARPIDEKEIAISRRRYVQAGGNVGEAKVPRHITTPTDRNANSKEVLQKLNEHFNVLNSFATTHSGAVQTAARAMPAAHKDHGRATMGLMSASENLALARTAFSDRNSAKGNEHLQKASRNLVSAHGALNSTNVREVTGVEVPIHKDELGAWQSHASNLPSFRRQGKPFEGVRVQMPNVEMKNGKLTTTKGSKSLILRPSNSGVKDIAKDLKGTTLGDKIARAQRGTPRTPKWERSETDMPIKSEKGTGVVNTRTKGTASGTTGENDPRRSGSDSRINVNLPKVNLPKIGDTSRPAKKPMKPGDTVEGK